MKLQCIFFFTFVLQISAYYDDVQEAASSMQDSFGQLLSDVATNVRASIDCSLLAVGQELDYDDFLYYSRLCKEEPSPELTYYQPPLVEEKQLTEDELNRNINVAKSDINDTIIEFLNRHSNKRRYAEETMIGSESISDENFQLKQNIDNISENIHKELEKIEMVRSNETVTLLLNQIHLLRNDEKNNTNFTNEIHQIIVEALENLNKTHTTVNYTELEFFKQAILRIEQESNKTYEDIERRFQEWQILEINRLDEIKALLEKEQQNIQNTTNTSSRSYKDIDKEYINRKSSLDPQDLSSLMKSITTTQRPDFINMTTINVPPVLMPKDSAKNYFKSATILSTEISTPVYDINDTSSSLADAMVRPEITMASIATTEEVGISIALTNETKFGDNFKMESVLPTMITPLLDNIYTTTESISTTEIIDDYDSFFESSDEASRQDAVKSATSVIEESKKSQSIFNQLEKF